MDKTAEPIYRKTRIGRPPLFETADQLWDKALEYFAYCDANPIKINARNKMKRSEKNGDGAETGYEYTTRPYTLDGLCLWCNINMPWATFKNNAKRRDDWADFEIVINACEQTIRDQQVTGAIIGTFSERLVARLNGIEDKSKVEVNQRQTTVSWEEYQAMLRGEKIE